ncbi:hypothetical protein [Streptomyces sp. NPDC000618]|uniref:hypothetical protein n=1 Tax=Streptomyces sp. NPDC000618 TaxID=3154265 RepID=UPI00332767E8
MDNDGIRGMLHLLKVEPALLPVAPDSATGEDIEGRRQEPHSCLVCGERATTALIVRAPDGAWAGKRWLDLCMDHFIQVREVA